METAGTSLKSVNFYHPTDATFQTTTNFLLVAVRNRNLDWLTIYSNNKKKHLPVTQEVAEFPDYLTVHSVLKDEFAPLNQSRNSYKYQLRFARFSHSDTTEHEKRVNTEIDVHTLNLLLLHFNCEKLSLRSPTGLHAVIKSQQTF
jgi:hypothetical protein